MTGKSTRQRERHVRFDSLDDVPAAEPLRADVRALDDAEIERRAAEDPDAGLVPPGFWDEARVVPPEPKEQITLRLDADVLRHFRASGKGYQSRINAVLKSYVLAQEKAS
ncbi:BrnA antitoxin family protein [Methylobacterium sp. NEAU 140]|uniref:BrnA antitoxin family protein n=1 Tax=Methylobacterium sp. NEAU 140 TaxID=3064945 RepID=UPI00273344A7|nr:BrnA antitoxin family protein [Methylobacterium sp. NEAU 140]MDP4021711.1 BrnA antitoxin family protein [Methylobacterium sp. NEAU 140]